MIAAVSSTNGATCLSYIEIDVKTIEMKPTRPLCFAGFLLASFVTIATTAMAQITDAPRYKLTDLGAISGYPNSRAYGLNNKGQVVGQVMKLEPKLEAHAALWKDGKVEIIAVPDDLAYGSARGINDAGVIVGGAEIENYGSNGFDFMGLPDKAYSWLNGKLTTLAAEASAPYSLGSHAYAINNHGLIAGESERGAVVWDNGKKIKLSAPPGFTLSSARAINEKGDVAGIVISEKRKCQVAVWSGGTIQRIGLIADDDQSIVGGINDAGQVAGSSGKKARTGTVRSSGLTERRPSYSPSTATAGTMRSWRSTTRGALSAAAITREK